MPIKLKALGLVMAAALAMGVFGSSTAAAQTTELEFDTASGFTTAASSSWVWTFGHLVSVCPLYSFSGSFTSPAKTFSMTPGFPTNCTMFGIANTHIINNGCAFDVTLNNTHSEGQTKTSGSLRLACGGSGTITFTPTVPIFGNSACTVHMQEQNIKGNWDIKINTAPNPDDVTLGPNTLGNSAGPDGISYVITNSPHTGLCPQPGTYNNGAFDLTAITMQMFSDAAHKNGVGVKLATN